MKPRRIIVLGATGSIGSQTLDCITEANRKEPGRFVVAGLSSNTNRQALLAFGARFPQASLALQGAPGGGAGIHFSGGGAVASLLEAVDADLVVNGISGSAGLPASVSTLSAGKNLALANKESVVMGHGLLKILADRNNLSIIPVDSEHAALYQLLSRIGADSVSELTITASGGPFRQKTASELETITPDEAARHPVWSMGRKISIDSATLANKGLELIEAVRLFGVPETSVKVLIHPESIVHALVRTIDGSLYAHMSSPDMRLPINIALHWPEEVPTLFGRLELAGKTLHFEEPDVGRFPMLSIARMAAGLGEAATIAYNAANEVAVQAFESGKLRFTDIASVVAAVIGGDWTFPVPDLGSIFDVDARARTMAHLAVTEFSC